VLSGLVSGLSAEGFQAENHNLKKGVGMRRFGSFLFIGLMLAMVNLTGCSISYTLNEPSLSSIGYEAHGLPETRVVIVDKRSGLDQSFTIGKIGFASEHDDISKLISFKNVEDPAVYLAQHLEKELRQRGIPAAVSVGGEQAGAVLLEVDRYQIVNYRATGFSPWEACHVFAGTIVHDGRQMPIKSYFYNGKVPVWSIDEIKEPCFEIPSSLMIQDIASKLNRAVFQLKASDQVVAQLVTETDQLLAAEAFGDSVWKVMELGSTNNAGALEPLKGYTQQGDELVRSTALSALGLVATQSDLGFLQERYRSTEFNEKYLAIKAIGDVGSPDAVSFIRGLKSEEIYTSEGGFATVVDLYGN
jgi:hypothetical protein